LEVASAARFHIVFGSFKLLGRQYLFTLELLEILLSSRSRRLIRVMTFDAAQHTFAVNTILRERAVLDVIEGRFRLQLAVLRVIAVFRQNDRLVWLRRARARNGLAARVNSVRWISAVRHGRRCSCI